MKKSVNQRFYANLSGVSIIVMAIVAGLAMGLVFAPVLKMDLETFSTQLPEFKSSLLYGILGWVVILICDLLATWGLFMYYFPKNNSKTLAMGAFRLIYSIILGVAIVQLGRALASSSVEESYSLIHSFEGIWQFGLIFFGVHLLYLARLVCEKRTIMRILGGLLFIAGIGYFGSNIADLFIVDYEAIRPDVEGVFIIPMIFGEIGLAFWLLVKGGKGITAQKPLCVSESC